MKLLQRLTVISFLVGGVSVAGAQVPAGKAVSAGTAAAGKVTQIQRKVAAKTFARGALTRPPHVSTPLALQMFQQPLQVTGAVSVSSPAQEPVLSGPKASSTRYESPFAPFLREEEFPAVSKGAVPSHRPAAHVAYAGRSLESLRSECSALGILPKNWETYSRDELAHFLSLYQSMKESADAPSLFRTPAQKSKTKGAQSGVKAWAQEQPDFIASNYVEDEYTEPFTGPLTPLRMLVVNDEWSFIEPLRNQMWQAENTTLDYAQSVEEAIIKLKTRPEAYDIVLVDYHMPGGNGPSLSMWMYEQKLQIPVVLYALMNAEPEWLYKFNIKGRIDVQEDPQAVLNFARNIITTGRAYPNR